MKKIKLIIFILFCSSFALGQVDTANYNFLQSLGDGKYYQLISKNTVNGSAGQRLQTLILQSSSIDTTQFQYVPELNFGYYSMIENISSYYGMDSGKVRMMLYNSPSSSNSFASDSANVLFKNRNRTVTSRFTFSDKQTFTDSVDINKLIVDSITVGYINGSPFTPVDTSLFVKRSAFSQSISSTDADFYLGAQTDMFIESVLGSMTITSGNGDLTLQASGGNFYLAGIPTLSGGVTPASFDGYIVFKIGESTFIKLPYMNYTP